MKKDILNRRVVLMLLALILAGLLLLIMGVFMHLFQYSASSEFMSVGLILSVPISFLLIINVWVSKEENALLFTILMLFVPTIGALAYLYYLLQSKNTQPSKTF